MMIQSLNVSFDLKIATNKKLFKELFALGND